MSESQLLNAFEAIHTPLKDSALISQCLSICTEYQLDPRQLASRWDTYRYAQKLKEVTADALDRLKKKLQYEKEKVEKNGKIVKKEQMARVGGMASGSTAAATIGRNKVYNKENFNEILGDLFGQETKSKPTAISKEKDEHKQIQIKKEVTFADTDYSAADHLADSPTSSSLANQAVTPNANSLTSLITSSTSPLPMQDVDDQIFSPKEEIDKSFLTSLTPNLSTLSLPHHSLTAASPNLTRYTTRSDSGQVVLTYNPEVAATVSSSSEFISDERPTDVEIILTPTEIDEKENNIKLRYMYMQDDDIQGFLAERAEKMQVALVETVDYLNMVAEMKRENGGNEEEIRVKMEEKERKEKEEREKEKLREIEEREREKKEKLRREEEIRLAKEKELREEQQRLAAARAAAKVAAVEAEMKLENEGKETESKEMAEETKENAASIEGAETRISEEDIEMKYESKEEVSSSPPASQDPVSYSLSSSQSQSQSSSPTSSDVNPVPPPPVVDVSHPLKVEEKVKVDYDSLYDTDDIGLCSFHTRSQQAILICGRIVLDANVDEKVLCATNIQIEGDEYMSQGHRLNLRLGLVSSFSLFPGQFILAKGINTNGVSFIVESLMISAPAPPLSLSYQQVLNYNKHETPLTLITAAGPYTLTDDTTYTPLFDLLALVKIQQVDVLILQGPFVDSSFISPLFHSDVFEGLIKSIITVMNGVKTKIFIQPSTKDMSVLPIYPQPPFTLSFSLPSTIMMLPNPATIRINDLTIGLTSADILSHMVTTQAEYSKNPLPPSMPKLARLARHLISQQSYYPLYPPPLIDAGTNNNELADNICIDYCHASKTNMTITPSLLLLPSKTQRFATEVLEGSVCVNSNSLVRGNGGGTYAKVILHPKSEEELRMDREKGKRVRQHVVNKRMRVDIIKI